MVLNQLKQTVLEEKSRLKGLYHIHPEADILLCPKNRNDRVFNIPLKSVESALVSRLICVSDMSYLTAAIAEKI